ncbi:hypothetical protein E0500_010365 [Streptomyces sp. KM273126]|uniref:hypothetical protein n=1 Tax=Streptomyces sp. KM273126 TaxID=2545247 RepID=UPI00103B0BE6|nr:hypothetical protein [Streptomyces sp. KM273126]MBA2807802.1 hypothetical protein [Streptomyces sp. KM273126]
MKFAGYRHPAPGLHLCASEGGTCTFTGTRAVAHGAGTYTYKTATRSTASCHVVFDGDPGMEERKRESAGEMISLL